MIHTKCPNPELISRVLINLEKEITCSDYICKSSLVSRPSIVGGGGGAWYTLFAHGFTLNVTITSILIVTFANGLGLTDDVLRKHTRMRAIKGSQQAHHSSFYCLQVPSCSPLGKGALGSTGSCHSQ